MVRVEQWDCTLQIAHRGRADALKTGQKTSPNSEAKGLGLI